MTTLYFAISKDIFLFHPSNALFCFYSGSSWQIKKGVFDIPTVAGIFPVPVSCVSEGGLGNPGDYHSGTLSFVTMTVGFRVFLDHVSLVYSIGFEWERDSKSTRIKRPVLKDLGLEHESPAVFWEIVILPHCFESGPGVKTSTGDQRSLLHTGSHSSPKHKASKAFSLNLGTL